MKMKTNVVIALLTILFVPQMLAQEVLVPMRGNPSMAAYDEYKRAEIFSGRAAVGDTLNLPFFDDFSEPFSRLRTAADMYPNSDLWVNDKVYINNHMAINPISQGVATFDGLDERGRAYGFLLQGQNPSPQPADSLTSKPLDLSAAADTVYLSFYYQPQGMAPYAPGAEYKLVLEFKDTADLWETQWEAEGFDLEVFDFNRIMIPVTDEKFLYSGFQFRFTNYAFWGGNVDQWHVDYIKLDEGRGVNDTIVNDVSFLGQTSIDFNGVVLNMTSSILREYNNMPWTHYKENPAAFMGDTSFFAIRNNTDALSPSGKYTMQIYNAGGALLYTGIEASPQVLPSIICGNQENDCATVDGEEDLLYRALDYDLPTDVELSTDSMFFEVVHNITELSDDVTTNDRTSHPQLFYNYYAYDDGTAEAGYGLENLDSESMVALKYNIKKTGDRLVAIQYYLNPVEFNLENEPARLVVWSGNEEPETVLWESPDTNLYYTNQHNYFHHYTINDTVLTIASENIWIGWVQQPSTNPDLGFSFGFDKRTDASSKLRLNLGSTWFQSTIPGAVMIRPVFGEPYNWVGVDEKPSVQHVKVYPNPTTGNVYLEEIVSGQFRNAQISVYDLSGRSVYSATGYNGQLQLRHLTSGTYILRIDVNDGIFTERLVLQP